MSFDSDYHVEQSATGDVTLDKDTSLLTAIIAAPANVTLPLAADCKGDRAKKTIINDTTSVSTLSFVAAGSDTIVGITSSGAGDGAVLESDGYSKWFIVRGSSGVGAAVSEAEIGLADNTTNNVTSTKHGFAPKAPADATKFLNGANPPAYALVKDSDLAVTDITTNNATDAAHGFMPKLTPGVATASQPATLGPDKDLDVLAVADLKLGEGAGTSVSSTAAELNLNDGSLAGTSVASKTLALDAQKATDTLRATANLNVGGTGAPGAASVQTEITKAVTAFTDTVAKDVFTVTVPNAAHAALIEIDLLGVLGAGGAIGAGESVKLAKYQVVLARTAGVAVVPAVSAAIGGVGSKVLGGDDITSVVATLSAITGAVGDPQTFTILVAITRSGAGADNHTLLATARIVNANATGVTIA